MNSTTDSLDPPYPNLGKPPGSNDYLFVVGFFVSAILILALAYVYYKCKRSDQSQQQPATMDEDSSDRHLLRFSLGGLHDDVLVTFPTFLYSEVTMTQKAHTATDAQYGSDCAICLVNYKSTDVVRVLPECKHLFHVSCVDTWLKTHPTCPVCRKSPVAGYHNQVNGVG
ncbi:RING-H2 finger protein ATL70-like [Rutidosis leptorrhynchoides]|uniref:RING-H2 finger protein ATL70-like n=1 Tax=Rutidosis leptorrhynchoides TaxID=125765 RepID=UPI003A9A40B5